MFSLKNLFSSVKVELYKGNETGPSIKCRSITKADVWAKDKILSPEFSQYGARFYRGSTLIQFWGE